MHRQYPGFYSQSDLVAHMAAVTGTHGVGASEIASIAQAAAQVAAHADLTAGVHGLLKKYVISDNLLHSHDNFGTACGTTYSVVKTIAIDALYPPSTIRVKFDLRCVFTAQNAYGRIYKNGVAFGTERINGTTSYVTYSEDLSFVQGDTLELWVKADTANGAGRQNFRVYGDESPVSILTAIIDSNIGVADPFVGTNS